MLNQANKSSNKEASEAGLNSDVIPIRGNMRSHQFSSVFKYGGVLYLVHERDANGPRCMLFPPEKISYAIGPEELGQKVLASLDSFQVVGPAISAPEWEVLNRQLLKHFQTSSIAAFERKKTEVTVRRLIGSDMVELFLGTQPIPLSDYDAKSIGATILRALRSEQV